MGPVSNLELSNLSEFATKVVRFLEAEGETRAVAYDAGRDELAVGDGQALTHFIGLGRLKARHDAIAEASAQARVFERDLIALRRMPTSFDAAARRLYPRLRPRATLATLELRRQVLSAMGQGDGDDISVPHQEVNSALAVHLVFQLSEEAVDVGQDRLKAWGRSFDELLEVAVANLAALPEDEPRELRPGLWALTGESGHVAARLVVGSALEKTTLGPDAVAMAPNQNVLLFADPADDAALIQMARIGLEASQAPLGLWGVTMARSDGRWDPWLPEASRPSHGPLKLARLPGTARLYAAHRDIQAAWHEIQNVADEVSPLLAVQDDGKPYGSAVWQRGVATLLPPADRVAVVDVSTGEPRAWSVPWADLATLGVTLVHVEGVLDYWRATGDVPLESITSYPRLQ